MKKEDRALVWVGSSKKDIRKLPEDVKDAFGFALRFAQRGKKHPSAKPLKGFGGAGTLEVVTDHSGDTFRAVYTVRFAEAVYVLHVFQKKSKSGVKTPEKDLATIRRRLQAVIEERNNG